MTPNSNPSPALKPCPFCGGEARLFPVIIPFDADCDSITVQCCSCDAIGADVLVDQDVHGICDLVSLELEAITAWNTRALSQTLPAPGEVDRLREAINRALQCSPSIRVKAGNHGQPVHVIEYDCGDPWEILREALATVAAANDEGVAEALGRQVRIAAWNAAKKSGASDALGYAVVEAVVAEFAAIRLLLQGGGK